MQGLEHDKNNQLQGYLSMSNYKNQAITVYSNGYPIVPINKGIKAPRIKGWQDREFLPSDIRAGLGIKCGLGANPICAVDIDVTDAGLAERISTLYEEMAGYTIQRVGSAPKTMLIYRAANAGWSKAASQWFSDCEWTLNDKNEWVTEGTPQRVEVLGKGQQFVALHEHPDTLQPYEWVDMLGGIESVPAADLPLITEDLVVKFLEVADQLAEDDGMYMKPTPSRKSKTSNALVSLPDEDNFLLDVKVGMSVDEARGYLEYLSSDDHDLWIKIGMALKSEFGDNADALTLFDDWSAKATNYGGYELIQDKWDRFSIGSGGGVSIKTLIKLGNEAKLFHDRHVRSAMLEDYLSDIRNAVDMFELVDEVLPRLGSKLDLGDIVIIKAVKDATLARAKALSQPLTLKDIDSALGIRKEITNDAISRAVLFSEEGNAQRMIDACRDTIMFVPEHNSWYEWSTYYWSAVDPAYIEARARVSVAAIATDSALIGTFGGEEVLAFIQNSSRAQTYRNMVSIAKTDESVLVSVRALDADKNLFGVGNGAVDLTTGKLRPANPLDRITIASEVDYVAEAKCPIFEQTLSDVFFGDEEMITFFQRLMGYTMLGSPTEQLFVIPYGGGANGKSTIFGAISNVFGAHAKTADSSTLLGGAGGNAGGPREDILRLRGSRFVYVSEPDDGGVLKEGLIKGMSGGEAMAARGAYAKTTIEVVPTWTVFMPTNHKPIIKGVDAAIWRRIMPIPFDRNFETDPDVVRDLDRNAKLAKEQSGILNWLVTGALQYKLMGLKVPQKVLDAKAVYRDDMDVLAEWLDMCCVLGADQHASSEALFTSWRTFAEANGELKTIANSRSLGRRLSSKGLETFKNKYGIRGRGFEGISVRVPDGAQGFDDLSLED